MKFFDNLLKKQQLAKAKNTAFDVIVIAGQSNAEGNGLGDDELKYIPDNQIMSYANNRIHVTEERRKRGVFGYTFAKEYKESFLAEDRKLLLIEVAVGGTTFSKKRWTSDGDLYLNMLTRINDIKNLNPANKFKAVLWHQGESDAENGVTKEQYFKYMTDLIDGVRALDGMENVPFIAGNMVPEWMPSVPATKNVELGAREAVAAREACGYVESDGLNGNINDIIHFSRKSNIELGKRYFAEYKKLI